MNAAIISYLIDIVIQDNIYGYGGFIYNESLIFILNALYPPLVWLVDPWSIIKNWQRRRAIKLGDKALLTQQETNELMEEVNYLAAKRYADIMKTMWFTFFFGTAIPIGCFLSCLGLITYYFIDKYNILRRRTVKENISKDLSMQMISMLSMIVVFSPVGEMTMSYAFYGTFSAYDIILLTISLIYVMLPVDRITLNFFPLQNAEEVPKNINNVAYGLRGRLP
jgi:hypothetical protein